MLDRTSVGRFGLLGRSWFQPVALVLITALAALFRFWRLGTVPPGFHYDEAFEAIEAWRVLTQPGYHPIFFPGNFGVEPIFIYLTGLAFRIFGASPMAMRVVAAFLGTITVPLLYAFGKELTRSDERMPAATPLLAAFALAIMRWHVHFSRIGIEPVLVPLFLVLILWALWRGLRANQLGVWILLGLLVGLSPYTYPAGRLLPLVVLAVVAAFMLTSPASLRGRWQGLLIAGAVAALTFAPLGWHWAHHPDQLFLRSAQIAAVRSGSETAAGSVGIAGGASAQGGNLGRSLLASLGMFSIRGDADPRNNVPGMPGLDVLMSIPFCLGVLLALWRWRRPAYSTLLLAGLIMLAPTVFSEYAPHFRRALGTTPIVAMLCGLGLATILGHGMTRPTSETGYVPWRLKESGLPAGKMATSMDRLRSVGRIVVVAAILVGSTILSAVAYFGLWAHSPALYYAFDQGLWEIGQYVLELPADGPIYVSPRPASDPTLGFAWRKEPPLSEAKGPNVRHFDGRHALVVPLSALEADKSATYIVIEHEDFRGAGLLRELFPQAIEAKTFLDRDGEVYARALRVQGPASLVRQPQYGSAEGTMALGGWPEVELIGYDLNKEAYQPGDVVYLQLWWRAKAPITTDWTVFTHLLGPAKADGSTLWAGHDARPGQGSAPMTTWFPGDLVLDEYQLHVPADAPLGEYVIEVGLYDLTAGARRALTTDPPGQDHLILGTVKVEQREGDE